MISTQAPADADDEYGAALRDTLAFLKVTKFPTYLISDMTEADDEHPGGRRRISEATSRTRTRSSFRPFAEKALARRDGLDVKYAILRDPKFRRRCSATGDGVTISVMGVPTGLVDQAPGRALLGYCCSVL